MASSKSVVSVTVSVDVLVLVDVLVVVEVLVDVDVLVLVDVSVLSLDDVLEDVSGVEVVSVLVGQSSSSSSHEITIVKLASDARI